MPYRFPVRSRDVVVLSTSLARPCVCRDTSCMFFLRASPQCGLWSALRGTWRGTIFMHVAPGLHPHTVTTLLQTAKPLTVTSDRIAPRAASYGYATREVHTRLVTSPYIYARQVPLSCPVAPSRITSHLHQDRTTTRPPLRSATLSVPFIVMSQCPLARPLALPVPLPRRNRLEPLS